MFKDPVITPRLTLHPLRSEDEAAAVEILRSDPVARTYMLPELDAAGAKALFTRFLQITAREDRLLLGINLGEQLIGWLNDTEINGDTMELGWVIHPNFWGQGYATEAVSAILRALHQQGFRCIYAGAFSENTASIRVMEKSGMVLQEKTEDLEYRGKSHRCVFYASIQ